MKTIINLFWNQNRKRNIASFILLGLFAVTAAGTSVSNKTPRESPEYDRLHNQPVQIYATADELITQYRENQIEANSQFRNKLTQITGTVTKLQSQRSKSIVYVNHLIQCRFPESQLAILKSLRIGHKIKLSGYVRPDCPADEIVMYNCIVKEFDYTDEKAKSAPKPQSLSDSDK